MNYALEFKDYATKHMGISQCQFQAWEDIQNRIYGPSASLTPYILEEREMRATQK
jgi:hypothetical protein